MADSANDETADVSDADLVAGLQGMAQGDEADADEDAADDDDAKDGDDVANADDAADASDEVEEADSDDEAEDDDEADEEDEEDEPAGLAQVRKAEQRMRAKLDGERAELEQAKAAHAADVKAVQDFRDLAKRARYDRVGVLLALGVTPDQFGEISREFWAHSEEGAKDPKLKEAITKTSKERAQADELAELRKRLDEKDAAEQRAAEEATNARRAQAYLDNIAKAATAKTSPLAAHFLAKNATKTKQRLGEIAMTLAQDTGEVPSRREVLATYEKLRADELRELGLDPKTFGVATVKKGKPAVAAKGAAAAKPAEGEAAKQDDDVTDDDLADELAALRKRDRRN